MRGAHLALLDEQGNVGLTFDLSGASVSIGRHPDNDIAIQDELASRFHCAVEPDGSGGWKVRDLGSRNGTRVNDERVAETVVRVGDHIRIGKHVFRVSGADEPVEMAPVMDLGLAVAAPAAPKPRRPDAKAVGVWEQDLRQVLKNVSPSTTGKEPVSLIDARGKTTEALSVDAGGGASAMRLMLLVALFTRATDIHMEPKGEAYSVRLRVDGQMVAIADLPNQVGELAIGLTKAACHMKVAGRDALLEGHYSAIIDGRRLDFRASLTPSVHGQKLVLRVLNSPDAPERLVDLGLATWMLDRVRKTCEKDSGLLLVCGPTGCGKTTTLYNALREIDRDRRNVVTIEDPIEHHLDRITQIPVNNDQGATFGSLLRSVLRQDPDVILLGEIRDDETARVAMQAAMTGHLVFSTVHSKDTIGAVFRVLDLGVEPYLVANSLDLIVSQRLVRVLCESCKRAVRVTPGQASRMGRFLEGKSEVYIATGCARCLRTGYRGRQAIYEMLEFTDELRDVVLKEPTIQALRKVIEGGLFTSLTQSGWQLVARGITTMDEVDRVSSVG
ncbi:MAG: ATPase, T2SS/T4P/T4SS family [Phycisphaerales bacterium]